MKYHMRYLYSVAFIAMCTSPIQSTAQSQQPSLICPPWSAISVHLSASSRDSPLVDSDQPDGITERNISLQDLISHAYNRSVMPFRDDEVVGLPSWAHEARYDIIAKVDEGDIEAFKKLSNISLTEMLATFDAGRDTPEMLMLQHLLKDRFALTAHLETKSRSVFRLTVRGNGEHLHLTTQPTKASLVFSVGHLSGTGVPASFIAAALSMSVGRSVIDDTHLAGRFDFDLSFAPTDAGASSDNSNPDIFTALREQLGLNLASGKAAEPVLVVDHIERPTPN